MPYPSTLTSFSNPVPSDRLNSPSHSSVETAQNTGLTELQTYIGVITGVNASAVGTLLYDIKAPGSDGGGHVQTANRGGTGQTTYAQGDILIAANSSTLSRLVVGSDGQILKANSSVATGINWVDDSTPKVANSASVITIVAAGQTSVINVTLPGSTLGTSNAVQAQVFISNWRPVQGGSVIAAAQYGGQNVASVVLCPVATLMASITGVFSHTVIADAATNAQRHFLKANMSVSSVGGSSDNTQFDGRILLIPSSMMTVVKAQGTGTSSINSTADQTYGMTIQGFAGGDGSPVRIVVGGYTIGKLT